MNEPGGRLELPQQLSPAHSSPSSPKHEQRVPRHSGMPPVPLVAPVPLVPPVADSPPSPTEPADEPAAPPVPEAFPPVSSPAIPAAPPLDAPPVVITVVPPLAG